MILEIEGKRVEVDSSFANLSDEEKQATVDHIAASMQPQKDAAVERDVVAEGLNEIMGPAGGAAAGAVLGKTARSIQAANIADAMINPAKIAERELLAKKYAVENWGRAMHQVPGAPSGTTGLYFGQPEFGLESNLAKQELSKMMADPEYHAKVMKEQKPAIQAYEKRINPSMGSKASSGLTKVPLGFIGGGAAGIGAGLQAADAMNRWDKGDKLGAAIGGLGSLGTMAAIVPHPVFRVGGTAVSVGSELLNGTIDKLKGSNPMQSILDKFKPKIENAVNTMVPQNVQQGIRNVAQPIMDRMQPQQQPQQPQGMARGGSVRKYAAGGSIAPQGGLSDLFNKSPTQAAASTNSSSVFNPGSYNISPTASGYNVNDTYDYNYRDQDPTIVSTGPILSMGPNNTNSNDLVGTTQFNYNPVSGFSDTSGGGSNMGVSDMNNVTTPTAPSMAPVPVVSPGGPAEQMAPNTPTMEPISYVSPGGPAEQLMPNTPTMEPISYVSPGGPAEQLMPNAPTQEYPTIMTHAVDPSWYKTQQYMAKGGSVNKRPKGITKAQWHAHQMISSKKKNG